tara:strand:- start:3828 stop:5000 length:1173 start_codon:yes stop_codon:yes gene_type:complete
MNWLLGKTNQAVNINARTSIVAIVFLSVIGPCVFILQPGYVQGLVEYLGFNDVQAGYIASGEMFGVAACTIIMVFLSQKYNWRGLVAICLAICTLGNLLSVSVTDFERLLLMRFITGLGSGGVISLGFTMMGLTQKADRNFGFVITWVLIYGAFGLWAMPSAYSLVGMNGVLIFFAIFCLSGFYFLRFLPIGGRQDSTTPNTDAPKYALRIKGISLLSILVYNIAIGITWAYLFLLGLEASIPEQTVANVLTISQFLGIAGAFIAVLLQLRIGRTIPLMIGLLGGAISVYCLVGEIDYLLYSGGVYLFNLLWNLSMPYLLATLADFDPTARMVTWGVSMQMVGTAAGPSVAALILSSSDYDSVYLTAAALFVASAILLLPGLRAQTVSLK